MNRPTLSDFNLTEKSKELYNQQIEEHNKVLKKVFDERQKRNKTVVTACWIPSVILFILFVVFAGILNNGGGGSTVGCIFLLVATFVYPYIVAKFFYLSDIPLSDFEKRKQENFEKSLGIITDKYKYVDRSLEENLRSYDLAISDFNDYQMKLSIDFWVNLSGYQFETEVANLYSKLGYSSTVTRATGDGGVDIVLRKGMERIAVQCKHHKNKVGPNDVRALQGVVYNGNYSYGIFVSLNGFTPTVTQEIANGKVKIELVELNDLIVMEKCL